MATVRGSGLTALVVVHGFSGGHRHGSFQRLLGWFAERFLVVAIDLRGHANSTGHCTLGHLEVLDVDAAVGLARQLGAQKVFTVGFSLGAACVLRQAALAKPETVRPEFDRGLVVSNAPDGVISVGGTSQWFYRGSLRMFMLHFLVSSRLGSIFVKNNYQVSTDLSTWPEEHHPRRHEIQPLDPRDCVAAIAPSPLLIVQGEHDNYFPREHGERLHAAAQVDGHQAEYWFVANMGHAENAMTPEITERVKNWVEAHVRSGK